MADVFISYSKLERSLTEDLASVLVNAGISVWWDTSLVSGDDFRKVIVRELATAKAAIVIWTGSSVQSEWVISEAQRAATANKLIPVRAAELDPSHIPPPFDVKHTELIDNRPAIFSALRKFGINPTTTSTVVDNAPPISRDELLGAQEYEFWVFIKNRHDPKLIREFVSRFPCGIYFNLARQKLLELENRAWEEANEAGTIAALQGYIDAFSDGDHVEDAKRFLAKLKSPHRSRKAGQPHGARTDRKKRHSNESLASREKRKKWDELWKESKRAHTVEAYEKYLAVTWPDGQFIDDAQAAIFRHILLP